MTLNDLIEQLDRELTLAEHYHANSQTWKLAVSLAKIQDIARKAEWECNGIIYAKSEHIPVASSGSEPAI